MENLEKINKQNLTIFYALFAGQAFFLLVAGYLLRTSGPKAPDLDPSSFQIILPIITLAGIFGSNYLYKYYLKALNTATDDTDKINKYRTAFLVKFALLEGANIFSIIVYMLTGSNLALIISVCLLILFILNKPSLDKIKEDLGIR
jgi:hypothetical protein